MVPKPIPRSEAITALEQEFDSLKHDLNRMEESGATVEEFIAHQTRLIGVMTNMLGLVEGGLHGVYLQLGEIRRAQKDE